MKSEDGMTGFLLDHFAFEVTDMDEAVRFYHDILGLKLLSRGAHEEVREEYAFLDLGCGTLELLSNRKWNDHPPAAPDPGLLNCPHLAFQTDNMDDVLEMIERENLKIIKGPLEIKGKERWIYISDPDGNVVEFIHWV